MKPFIAALFYMAFVQAITYIGWGSDIHVATLMFAAHACFWGAYLGSRTIL